MKLGGQEIRVWNASKPGNRSEQQDYFAIHMPRGESIESLSEVLLVLADGMGGHDSGGSASVIATDAFVQAFELVPGLDPRTRLEQAARVANERVFAAASGSNMGTTLSALHVTPLSYTWLSVGDSPILLIRNNQCVRLNRDHNLAEAMSAEVAAGRMSVQQYHERSSEHRALTSYLGLPEIPLLDTQQGGWQPGDVFVLSSDGVTDALNLPEVTYHVIRSSSEEDFAQALVQAAIGKGIAGQDNTTAVGIRLCSGRPSRVLLGRLLSPPRSGLAPLWPRYLVRLLRNRAILTALLGSIVLTFGGIGAFVGSLLGEWEKPTPEAGVPASTQAVKSSVQESSGTAAVGNSSKVPTTDSSAPPRATIPRKRENKNNLAEVNDGPDKPPTSPTPNPEVEMSESQTAPFDSTEEISTSVPRAPKENVDNPIADRESGGSKPEREGRKNESNTDDPRDTAK